MSELKEKKQKALELNLKREIALFILDKCSDNFYQLLLNKINNAENVITPDAITRILSQTFCFGDKINIDDIEKKIKTETADFCNNN